MSLLSMQPVPKLTVLFKVSNTHNTRRTRNDETFE